MKSFEVEKRSVKDLFSAERNYLIPKYQREYKWDLDNAQDYWDDLVKTSGTPFFGVMIFCPKKEASEVPNAYEIVDGQQRFITTTILLAVIRDAFAFFCENLTNANEIQKDNIRPSVEDADKSPDYYRLTCGDSLNNFFRSNIQAWQNELNESVTAKIFNTEIEILNSEQKRIKEVYNFFFERIEGELQNISGKDDRKAKLIEIKKRVTSRPFIEIVIDDEADAYVIFEMVNARGTELQIEELMKNYIYSLAASISSDEKVLAESKWEKIGKNIAQSNLTFPQLLKYYFLAFRSEEFVSEKDLYRPLRNYVVKENYNSFLDDLSLLSEFAQKMCDDDERWEDFFERKEATKNRNAFIALRDMKVRMHYTLFFFLLLHKDKIPQRMSAFTKKIEVFHLIYNAICSQPANQVEKLYFKYAKKLRKLLEDNKPSQEFNKVYDDLFKELFGVLESRINEGLFIEQFKKIRLKEKINKPFIRYLLKRIELIETPNEELPFLSIEHILPRDPVNWGYRKKDVVDFVNSIGNLTLVSEALNRILTNHSPEMKMSDYAQEGGRFSANLQMNKEVVKILESISNNSLRGRSWDQESVDLRSEQLARSLYSSLQQEIS